MSRKNKNYSRVKIGDYLITCDICGQGCWASEATVLDTYTGKGGLVVCPIDNDKIDYGLMPLDTGAEQVPPITRNAQQQYTPGTIINLDTTNPLSINNPEEDL